MRHARHTAAAVLALGVALAGCRKQAATTEDSTFIATMAELRQAERRAPLDSAPRLAVLRRRRVTVDSLERIARMLARDPARASRVWTEIERRTNAAAMEQGQAAAGAAAGATVPPPTPPPTPKKQ